MKRKAHKVQNQGILVAYPALGLLLVLSSFLAVVTILPPSQTTRVNVVTQN